MSGYNLKQPDLFDIASIQEINVNCKPVIPTAEEVEKWIIQETAEEPFRKYDGLIQSTLFDVEAIEETNKAILKKRHKEKIEEAKKEMDLPYFSEPKDDNQRMMNYQHDYLKNGDQEAWGKLLTLAMATADRIAKKEIFEHRLPIDEIDRDEKVSIAIEYVLRRYSTTIGWYVKTNWILALKQGVRHALYYQTKKDAETDSLEVVMIGRI